MCKSARTVIILWSDHVHNTDITQEREPASSSPQLLFRSEFMRKPQMRVDLPGTAANDFRFILLYFLPAPQLMVILQNRKCFALQLSATASSRLWQVLGSQVDRAQFLSSVLQGTLRGLRVVLHGVLCPTVLTHRTSDLACSCQCGHAA